MSQIRVQPVYGGTHLSCGTCGAATLVTCQAQAQQFAAMHQHPTHYGLGDVVRGVTSAFGAQPCAPCEERQRRLNGWLPRVWRR